MPVYGRLSNLQYADGCRPSAGKIDCKSAGLSFGRAGYQACNMLANYCWRSMVKLNKIGEYNSILMSPQEQEQQEQQQSKC
jgi:hypothetical protein